MRVFQILWETDLSGKINDMDEEAVQAAREIGIIGGTTLTAFVHGFHAGRNSSNLFTEYQIREAIAAGWNSCEDNEEDEPFSKAFERILKELKLAENF